MKTALLVADLEGVAGVEGLSALFGGSAAHARACELLTLEVAAAVKGLRRAGFTRVRVSDSHRSGLTAPNIDPAGLPKGTELRVEEDPFAPALFEKVSAAACLGMHAAAGQKGFAAHTVGVHCAFLLGRRSLSETELFLGLCAERGVPFLFASGEEGLGQALGRVRFVGTTGKSATQVHSELLRAAQGRPRPAPSLAGPLTLKFKSRWQQRQAIRAGARPAQEASVWLDGSTLREQYWQGLRLVAATEPTLSRALRGSAGQPRFEEDGSALLLRSFARRAPPSMEGPAQKALQAFLRHTEGPSEWMRADRALTLHMLEGHAPSFFAWHNLSQVLAEAVDALQELPASFPSELDPEDAMARLDALYVLSERGLLAAPPDPDQLRNYIAAAHLRLGNLWGWVLDWLSQQVGLPRTLNLPTRPCRDDSRLEDLYWLTHLFFFHSRYLRRPLGHFELEAETEEVLLACAQVMEARRLDLAAELALCLQLAGEHSSQENRSILRLLARKQRPDGTLSEGGRDGESASSLARREAHCTAAGLLAFAGAGGEAPG